MKNEIKRKEEMEIYSSVKIDKLIKPERIMWKITLGYRVSQRF